MLKSEDAEVDNNCIFTLQKVVVHILSDTNSAELERVLDSIGELIDILNEYPDKYKMISPALKMDIETFSRFLEVFEHREPMQCDKAYIY